MSFGRITKLNVHIAKCQTHIIYANETTRLLTNNPSGFAFRSKCPVSWHCDGDSASQASCFLQRHFGPKGSIEKSTALCAFLFALGVDYREKDELQQQELQHEEQTVEQQTEQQLETEAIEEQLLLEEEQTQPVLQTWKVEQLPTVQPQRATAIDWHQEQLQIFNCAWHLLNCNWRHVPNSEFQLPNCHCHKIKQMTEYINSLLKASLPALEEQQEKPQEKQQSMPDVNANIMSLNSMLQQLNELLEQQNEEQAI